MISIKQLQIGCHVLVEGKMVKVCGITQRKIGYHHPGWRKEARLCYARDCEVEPIPITPELLEKVSFYQVDNGKWRSTFSGPYARLIRESNWPFDPCNMYSIIVKVPEGQAAMHGLIYLHQLETFLYSTIGINLISD